MVYALRQLGYKVKLNDKSLKKINDYFTPLYDKYLSSGLLDPYVLTTKVDALTYQIPGGMLSNLISQLKAQNAIDKLDEVLAETPRVRADLGYPPLVTPMSQMVGVQATLNVLFGERYKNVTKEVKAYVRGEYGNPPGPINKEIESKILGDEKKIEGRFADTLKPGFEQAKAEIGSLAKSDEDVLSYVAFPQQAREFFENRGKSKDKKETKGMQFTIERVE